MYSVPKKVPEYRYPLYRSTGIRFKKVKIIKTYNPYTKILNFVLLIWEERNLGCYEHARACRERVHAPRASEKTHQPSNDIIMYTCRSLYLNLELRL